MTDVEVDLGEIRVDHISEIVRHEDVAVYSIQTASKGPRVIAAGAEFFFSALDPVIDEGRTLYTDEEQKGKFTTIEFPEFDKPNWHSVVEGGGWIYTITFYHHEVTDNPDEDPEIVWAKEW